MDKSLFIKLKQPLSEPSDKAFEIFWKTFKTSKLSKFYKIKESRAFSDFIWV